MVGKQSAKIDPLLEPLLSLAGDEEIDQLPTGRPSFSRGSGGTWMAGDKRSITIDKIFRADSNIPVNSATSSCKTQ